MVAIAKGKCGFFHQLIMKLYGGARKRHEKGSEVNWYKKEEKSKRKKKKKINHHNK